MNVIISIYGGFTMKKSSLFISTILTTFILAVLAGAMTAYRSLAASDAQDQQPTPVAQTTEQPTSIAQATEQPTLVVQVTPTQTLLTPEQASQVAAQYWGRNDLYSVESIMLKGLSTYKVTFSSGDVVYVLPQGKVVGAYAAPRAAALNNNPSSQPSINSSDGEHEHDDD
jgi:hypothetical protein